MTRDFEQKILFAPFQNEADSVTIGDLSIENRVDRISIFGSIDITLDSEGLKKLRVLHNILDEAKIYLEDCDARGKLPKQIKTIDPQKARNPFVR